MFMDYHLHSSYSADGKASIKEQLDAAKSKGISHLCFTDHVDFNGCTLPPADIHTRNEELQGLIPLYPEIDISFGMEIGMKGAATVKAAMEHVKGCHVDFIIGSVHMVDGIDTYYPEYYESKTKQQAYAQYLVTLKNCLAVSEFSVMGHYDFCAKYAPYDDRSISYKDFSDHFDEIFRLLISRNKGMEINTAAWRDAPSWGMDILKRYRELGGEYITIGSDAHTPDRVGNRFNEALGMAMEANIPYLATFKNLEPIFHKL